jgi:abhydrolase domain-containing protein 12
MCRHILPKSLTQHSKGKEETYWESCLRESEKPVIIYFHGNMGTRGTEHRVELYRLFQEEDSHVIAFDYRGFADSTGSPSETGLVADGHCVYAWLRKVLGDQVRVPVYLWGHSLGTGLAISTIKYISCDYIGKM